MKTLNILFSAYACRPDMGSEPGLGWNIVKELSRYHRVWVLTRSDNQTAIEAELHQFPNKNLFFLYCNAPLFLDQLPSAQVPHYYFWQVSAYFAAKKLLRNTQIDVIHHYTYSRYSTPSFLSTLPVPFVWGPVGGGEMAPNSFFHDFRTQGKFYEILRTFTHRLGEFDPFVRMTINNSDSIRATTEETAVRLRKMGASKIQVVVQVGMSQQEIYDLESKQDFIDNSIRFISIARLLHWKGIHLGIRAFAAADLPDNAEYWILGDGPERLYLQSLSKDLGVSDKVKFLGNLSRDKVLLCLKKCRALVHPSLHDSGGLVCLEAMAAGLPGICLDLGGPAIQVTEETGFKVSAHTPEQAVHDLSLSMVSLSQNPELSIEMGIAGRERVKNHFSWEVRGLELTHLYTEICYEGKS